jgi:hypothetical protein
MTLVIPAGYAQAAIRYSLTGDPEVMVTTIGVDTSSAGGDFEQVATDFRDGWAAGLGTVNIGIGWTWLDVVLRFGQDGGGGTVVVERAANIVGTDVQGHLPQNNTMLVRKQTALGGRRGRGRMFLPAAHLRDDQTNDAGVIDSTFRAGVDAALAATVAAWVADGIPPVLLHEDTPLPVPAPTPITSLVCDRMIATQRRRLRR